MESHDERSTHLDAPWSFTMTLTKKDESQRIYEYACQEGNYGLQNILSGARSADQLTRGSKGAYEGGLRRPFVRDFASREES
jgi:hypothetical protein